MLKHTLSVLFLAFLAHLSANAQPVNNLVKDIVMPAPNAGSLGKYGDIPVSYFTGVPNISVPIHTVQEGPLSLPVSLSYHASGIKVAETASWVGLGWSLNAGGMITRTVQGIRDDATNGYYYNGASVPALGSPDFNNFVINVSNGTTDGEPDIFSFNFGNYSGKFYFDKDQTCQLVPRQDLKVIKSTGNFNGFTIIAPDGTRYVFGETSLPTARTAHEYTVSGDEPNPGSITSWYLLRVESYDQNHAVNLYYAEEAESYSYRSPASCKQIQMITGCQSSQGSYPSLTQCSSSTGDDYSHPTIRTSVQGKRLIQIVSGTGIVEFVPSSADRSDLDYNPTTGGTSRKRLREIRIYPYTTGAIDNNYCSKYQFYTSYYQDPNKNTTESKRLRLDSIQRKSCDSTILEPAYKFSYEAGQPAYRLSKQVDHWGFYNGQSGNESKLVNIPPTTYTYNLGGGTPTLYSFGESNRETSETHLKMGVLKEMTYPTGGKTTFTYEANRIKQAVVGSPVYVPSNGQYWLKSCNNPLDSFCCGVQKKTSQTYTFSAADGDLNLLKFDLYLTRLIPVNTCNGQVPTYVAVTLTVYDNGTNAVLGQTGFNLSTDQNSYSITALLKSGLVPTLQTGVTYKFELSTTDGYAYYHMYNTPITDQNVAVGGLRIKEIRNHDGVSADNDVVRTYDYKDENGAFSSAKFLYRAKYVYTIAPGIVFTESPAAPMGGFDNSYHIGYTRVKEIFAGNAAVPQANGYTIYQYDAYERDPNPNAVYQFPLGVPQTISDQGALLSAAQFTENGMQESIASNTSAGNNVGSTFSVGVIVKVAPAAECGGSGVYLSWWKDYIIRHNYPYRLQSASSTIDGVTTITNYEYDGFNRHLAPVAVYFTNSDGKVQRTENKYVFDLQGGDPLRQPLIDRNIIGAPLEVLKKVGSTPTNTTIVDGSKTEYSFFDKTTGAQTTSATNSEPRPWKFYRFEMTWDANGAYVYAPGNWVEQGRIVAYHGNGSVNGKGLPATFRPGNDAANWPNETYTWLNALIKTRTYENFTWTYDYHNNTRLVSKITNLDGQETWYDYDKLMRTVAAYSRPSTAGDKNTSNVKTDFTYTYRPITAAQRNFVKTRTIYTPVANSSLNTVEDFQYFDGLGRLVQRVGKQQSPSMLDVVTNVQYDNQGREWKTYAPVQGTGNTGAFASATPSGPHTLVAYGASPLNRVVSVTPPSWYATLTAYGSNESPINHPNGTTFTAHTLMSTFVTDPNGNIGITYKDKKGRHILSRRCNSDCSQTVDTYVSYDDKDRQTVVYPPDASNATPDLLFKYLYDWADNPTNKKIPGKAEERIWYNDRNLQTLYQDGKMSQDGRWMMTEYDDYGRALKTGFSTNMTSFGELLTETIYDNLTPIYKGRIKQSKTKILDTPPTNSWIDHVFTYDAYGRLVNTTGNNHLNLTAGSEARTVNSYDFADHVLQMTRQHKKNAASLTTIAERANFDHQGRKVDAFHKVNSAPEEALAHFVYNHRDFLMTKSLSQGPFGGWMQNVDYSYNEQGWLTAINGPCSSEPTSSLMATGVGNLSVTVSSGTSLALKGAEQEFPVVKVKVAGSFSPQQQGEQSFNVESWHQILYPQTDSVKTVKLTEAPEATLKNEVTLNWKEKNIEAEGLAAFYQELRTAFLKRLEGKMPYGDMLIQASLVQENVEKALMPLSAYAAQTVNTAIDENIASGQTGALFIPPANGFDLFAMKINYDVANPTLNAPQQKNGNITSISYAPNCGAEIVYGFSYDYLDRITKATNATYDVFNGGYIRFNFYNEEVPTAGSSPGYDKRGNINRLSRNAKAPGGVFVEIDQLQYAYSGNQLTQITEAGTSGSDYWKQGFMTSVGTATYIYDVNGNMTRDNHKNMAVEYNHLNLPKRVAFDNGYWIEFLYDANGRKLRKTTSSGVLQNYCDGIEYVDTTLDVIYHAEGRYKRYSNSDYFYEYDIKDHLGSTWVSFYMGQEAVPYLIQTNIYYPSGLLWSSHTTSTPNPYTYNGKERVTDGRLEWYDYGARWYDPAVGRWWSVDPLAEKYGRWSPYNYGADNPVRFMDPDGMQIVIGYKDANNNEQKYIYGSKDPTPDNKFVQQVVGTLDKLVELGADQNGIINTLKDDDSYSQISEIGWDEHNSNVAGAIVWSPQGGIVTDEGDRRSPSLGLLHELGHVYYAKYDPVGEQANAPNPEDYKTTSDWVDAFNGYENENKIKSGQYENLDDKWVIEKVEAVGAKVLGQAQRTSHHYKTKYKAETPFSLNGPEKKQ